MEHRHDDDDDDDALLEDKELEALDLEMRAPPPLEPDVTPPLLPPLDTPPPPPPPPPHVEEALIDMRHTPKGLAYYQVGRDYMICIEGQPPKKVGHWLPFGTGDTRLNPAVQCEQHGSKCKRSASTNKYLNAEGALIDWVTAGLTITFEEHKAIPRPPKDRF